MSFFNWLFKKKKKKEPEPEPQRYLDISQVPASLDLADGMVKLRIESHNIELKGASFPAWSFISSGFSVLGQKEMVLTLKREDHESETLIPADILTFFKTILTLASQGRFVQEGGFSQLGEKSRICGFQGMIYSQLFESGPFDLPPSPLQVTLVTEKEIVAAQRVGHLRVLSRLGHFYKHYPWPSWNDRKRTEINMTDVLDNTILNKVRCGHFSGLTVTQEESTLVIRISEEAALSLSSSLDEFRGDVALGLLTELEKTASSCLIWRGPTQKEPTAISRTEVEGSICGNFLVLATGVSEDSWYLIEDGFGLTLSSQSWAAFRAALKSKENWALSTTDGCISLEWVEPGWSLYRSEKLVNDDAMVMIEQIVLRDSEAAFKKALGNDKLILVIKQIKDCVETSLADHQPPDNNELLIIVTFSEEGQHYQIASRPGLENEVLYSLNESLEQIPATAVNSELSFELYFKVAGVEE
jgi:hypothetical protein